MNNRQRMRRLYRVVPQEHAMGCAVACVASRCGINYQQALVLFSNAQSAWTTGYYCSEVVAALENAGLQYRYESYYSGRHARLLDIPGTIVFIEPNTAYSAGHCLLRVPGGWMNSWSNCPLMLPSQAAVQTKRIGKVAFVIYEFKKSEYR